MSIDEKIEMRVKAMFEGYLNGRIPKYKELLSIEEIDKLQKLYYNVVKWSVFEKNYEYGVSGKKQYRDLRIKAEDELEIMIQSFASRNNMQSEVTNRGR